MLYLIFDIFELEKLHLFNIHILRKKSKIATTKTVYMYINKYGSHCYMSLKYSVFCLDNGVLL